MTTTVLTRGSDWGVFANHGVYANWGDAPGADTDKTFEMLGDMVVARFHELCAEQNINAYWSPNTSEVTGDIDQDLDAGESDEPGILDQLRIQATEGIWNKWTNGEIDPIMASETADEN